MLSVKKVLYVLMAVFLGLQSYRLVTDFLRFTPERFTLAEMVFVAFLLNLFVTGVFAFPGFVFPTHRLLGKSYYKLRNTKLLQRIYRIMGVSVFRKLLLVFFWGKPKNRQKYFNGTRKGLTNFDHECKQSEFGHLGAFVIIVAICLLLLAYGHVQVAIITSLINIIGNLYPIILQRHHRIRLERILAEIHRTND